MAEKYGPKAKKGTALRSFLPSPGARKECGGGYALGGRKMTESSNPHIRVPLKVDGTRSLPFERWMEDIFEPLIDSMEEAVFVLDRSGTIHRVNRYFLNQYPWSSEDVVGQNIFELMPDLNDLGVKRKFDQIIDEGRILELTNLQRKNRLGKNVVFNLKGIPIKHGDAVNGVLALMHDITEKWTLESQVAETEEYLQKLIDNANDIIYTLDAEGYITFLNKMGQEITGYRFDPRERAHYTEYVIEKDLAKNERHFREAIRGKHQRYATTIIAMDGRLVSALLNITPIRKGNRVVGVLGIARDITERKQMEAQLMQASKMAAIGELAAGVAHEINNPAAIISGTAEQLQFLIEECGDRPEDMKKRLLKHVGMIHEQAARCKRITQGLLNFARRTEVHTTDVNVAKLIQETLALVENRALSEKKNIKTQLPDDVPTLQADPHQLEQVFLNLVNNALDAVEENGLVTIAVRTENKAIVIDVADNGGGIHEEDQRRVFDPFFTNKPVGKGTGLGLSICFGIVQRMHGEITVESVPGQGARFTVTMPVKQPEYKER
jgi:PAS domain S-box-containing protein